MGMWGSVDASMDGCIYLCESGRVCMYVSIYLSVYVCEYVCLSDMDDIM